jgi:nicotinate phosphoribosyltransferase|nr:MAG TPA: PncB-like protein [Crassvirales sp.]
MEIKSILDTDLYKFSVSYAYMKLFPDAIGTFEFVDRNESCYTEEDIRYFDYEIANLAALRLNDNEKKIHAREMLLHPRLLL